MALVSIPSTKKNKEFVVFHQQKTVREAYMRMRQKMYGMNPMRQVSGFYGGFYPQMQPNMGMGMPMGMPMGMQMPMAVPMPVPMQIAPPSVGTPGTTSRQSEKENPYNVEWLKKNKKEFGEFSQERKKTILGNLMFNRVKDSKQATQTQIPKVTGMLIDLEILDYAEIIDILENDDALKERIKEALDILEDPTNN